MNRSLVIVALFLNTIAFAVPLTSYAQQSFVEDFTSNSYKDAANTTADWDTLSGKLKLFPFVPKMEGAFSTPGYFPRRVAIAGHLAYVADIGHGLLVIDTSDPASPALVGSCDTPSASYGVAISGNLAFLAASSSGLQVVDISDPATPTLAGSYDTPGPALGVAVAGDHAFVAYGNNGLQVVDVSDPTNPTLAGNYDGPAYAWDVAIAGDLAFVATSTSGLQAIDISDPTNPTLAGSYDTPGSAIDVAIAGNLVFVADTAAGLQVIDISDPTSPALVGSYDTPGLAFGIAISGDLAYVADYDGGLQVIDISDPTNPTLAFSYDTPYSAYGVAVSGDLAYVADGSFGLQVIRIAEPTNPTLIGSHETPDYAIGIAVSGDFAFVCDFASGLQVFDINDPANPVLAGNYDWPGIADGVAVSGNHAFLADYPSGLQILDISDPANPTLSGSYDTPGSAHDVAVSGNCAIVADGDFGCQVIDISDPTNPTLAGSYDTPGSALSVTVFGDYALVADFTSGIQVINISDPTNPSFLGRYITPEKAFAIAISGDLAFVADGYSGLQVVDITDPANPTLVGSFDTTGEALGITVAGNRAYVADSYSGLQVIDIADPANPTLAGGYDTPGDALDVVVAGHCAFVADYTAGLQVIQVSQSEFNSDNNLGRSLAIDGANDIILKARLSSTQTAGVYWQLSADGGTTFDPVTPGGGWSAFTPPGSDLVWRTTHSWVGPDVNPSVSDVTIEWLNEFAFISSVADIPNDQGKQVRLQWRRSGHDFVGDTEQIVEYAVYRRIDQSLSKTAIQASGVPLGDFSATAREDALLKLSAGWDFITTIPVRTEDDYAVVVSTLADSTIANGSYMTAFMVSALTATPGLFFDSPPDSGYSVDNLAPSVPTKFAIAYNTGSGNTLSWDQSPEADFQYYRVYRSSDPNFIPASDDLAASTTSASWVDPNYDGGAVYYRVTATDFAGNESDPAVAEIVTAVPKTPGLAPFALHQNVPNPFNPSTTIRYDLPHDSRVHLGIYDLAGRLVRTLVAGEVIAAGQREAVWDGRDESGRSVSSGVYFCRLEAGEFHQGIRMALLK